MKLSGGLIVDIGEALWRRAAPWKRLKKLRNKRRAKRGLEPLPITKDDYNMLPNGSMTHTGGGLAAAGPVIMFLLQMIGVGECTPEALDMGCVGAAQITGAVVTLGGAVLVVIGRIRAKRTADAAVAAAKAQP